ncbi:putative Mg2+ transporter-C (MgtC) family protein [Pararhizobium capsulatum DSM 1112]|uniref:Protein MgtC n=1 Tax=Pararhizobium capsulatum DSM 1112 TaxID=1121113 RepID=A0ABU0BRE1_9HYPH|nr:MgtC/SapB family protein [Pararhizobium capsulatum]MDQ0320241.1 putative Mg2+ transporter-C (MgtC) family protein [Pararhizobium capsulatum DSM 1112]
MDAILADIFPETQISYPVMIARFCGALFFGAVIGFEREARDKAAGLRTHMLISLAACLFAVISIESVHMPGLSDEQVRIDPLRVVEAVTAGVAFLAAGTIVLSKGEVRGLTTGAGMWLAGAIGLALGFGHWLIAAFAVTAGIVVLFLVARIQHAWRVADKRPEPQRLRRPKNQLVSANKKTGRRRCTVRPGR